MRKTFLLLFVLMMTLYGSAQTHIYSNSNSTTVKSFPIEGGSGSNLTPNPIPSGSSYIWGGSADADYYYAPHSLNTNYVYRYDINMQNGEALIDMSPYAPYKYFMNTRVDDNYLYVGTEYENVVVRADKSDGGNIITYDFSGLSGVTSNTTEFFDVNDTYLFCGGGTNATSRHICRCNLDGTGAVKLFDATSAVMAISIDANYLYWRTRNGEVGRSDLDGTNVNNNFITGLGYSVNWSLAVTNNYIYVTNSSYELFRYDKNGENATSIATSVGNRGICFVTNVTNSTWTGTTNTDWNTSSNWSGGVVPTSTYAITIPNTANAPVVGSSTTALSYAVTINNGASLTINTGGSLSLTDLTIQSGGSFIDNGTFTGSGTVQVQQTIGDGEWHLISSPVSSATAAIFEGDYLQYWTEDGQTWTDVTQTTYALNPVQGYALWGVAKGGYTFSGTPNTGSKSISLSYSGVSGGHYGMNLVGNPYPSSIDWSTLNGTYGTAYVWNAASSDYIENTSTDIAPMQGFFIYTTNDGSSFTVTNTNRSHGGTFYKGAETLNNGLVLVASYGDYADEFRLNINEEAIQGFGLYEDAWKIISDGTGVSQLWSVSPDGKLAIDSRPYQESIVLGFANDVAGFYSIGIDQIAGITIATLEDTQENVFHDLTKGAYSFTWDPADDEGRFILHLGPTGVEDSPQMNNDLLIYAHDGDLHLKAVTGTQQGTLTITDMAGRTLYQSELTIDGEMKLDTGLSTGVYVVRFNTGKDVRVKKIIIN